MQTASVTPPGSQPANKEVSGLETAGIVTIYYPQEVRSMKHCILGVFMERYFLLVNPLQYLNCAFIWVVKLRNTSDSQRQYSGHNTPQGHHTDRGPMGLGQYDGLVAYCGLSTASSVFLILLYGTCGFHHV